MLTNEDLQGWIEGIQAGREDAYESFIRRYTGDIARVVSRFDVFGAEREEWVDVVLLHAVDRILAGKVRFLSVKAFNVWLYRVARHKCIECWRRRRRSRELPVETDKLDQKPDPGATPPETGMERAELRKRVAAAIALLTDEGQRETLHLVWIVGLTVAETALKLRRPLNTVRTWERRGKQALAGILHREFRDIVEEYGGGEKKR